MPHSSHVFLQRQLLGHRCRKYLKGGPQIHSSTFVQRLHRCEMYIVQRPNRGLIFDTLYLPIVPWVDMRASNLEWQWQGRFKSQQTPENLWRGKPPYTFKLNGGTCRLLILSVNLLDPWGTRQSTLDPCCSLSTVYHFSILQSSSSRCTCKSRQGDGGGDLDWIAFHSRSRAKELGEGSAKQMTMFVCN